MKSKKTKEPNGSRTFLPVPAEVGTFLESIKTAIGLLQNWDSASTHVASGHRKPKHFTPDGRMVGDIGEAIAERLFDIRLENRQKAGWDGVLETNANTKVEIKVTRKKAFQFRKITDRVIALSMLEGAREVEVILNGPGILLVDHVPRMKKLAKRRGEHWHFDKPFNVDPEHLRGLVPPDHEQRVPLRAGVKARFEP